MSEVPLYAPSVLEGLRLSLSRAHALFFSLVRSLSLCFSLSLSRSLSLSLARSLSCLLSLSLSLSLSISFSLSLSLCPSLSLSLARFLFLALSLACALALSLSLVCTLSLACSALKWRHALLHALEFAGLFVCCAVDGVHVSEMVDRACAKADLAAVVCHCAPAPRSAPRGPLLNRNWSLYFIKFMTPYRFWSRNSRSGSHSPRT